MIDVKLLSKIGNVKKSPPDKWICKEGDPGNEMYIILAGKLEVYIKNVGNEQIKVAELKEGDFFGEMSLIDNQPRSASIKTSVETVLCGINKHNFQEFISRQPMITLRIMKGLCTRIRSTNDSVINQKDEIKMLKKSLFELKADTLKNNLIPEKHKQYNIESTYDENNTTFTKIIKCPICKTEFNSLTPKLTSLKLVRVDSDYRKVYSNLEPIWYSIGSCPKCNFTNLINSFSSLSGLELKKLKLQEDHLQLIIKTTFTSPRKIDDVFISHYMAIFCLTTANANLFKIAKIWLQLSWLYKDVEDTEMHEIASQKAFDFYYKAYYNSNISVTENVEQQICIILAELLLKQDRKKDAYFHFQKALNLNTQNIILIKKIREKMAEIRSK